LILTSSPAFAAEGAADDEHIGTVSLRLGVAYTMVRPSSITLTQSSDITSITMSPPGVLHGVEYVGGLVAKRFQAEMMLGFSFARRSPVDDVTVDPKYAGTAYAGGRRPDADPWAMHFAVLLGPRIPFAGSFAAAAGPGIGFDLWVASPSEGGLHDSNGALKSSERISNFQLAVPLFAQLAWKPACEFAMTATAIETLGVAGAKISYPGLALGVVYESCQGTDPKTPSSGGSGAGGPTGCIAYPAGLHGRALAIQYNISFAYPPKDEGGARRRDQDAFAARMAANATGTDIQVSVADGVQPNLIFNVLEFNDGQDHLTATVEVYGLGEPGRLFSLSTPSSYVDSDHMVSDLADRVWAFLSNGWGCN
jgi:hypothetical protein